jgi:hypothetical protein
MNLDNFSAKMHCFVKSIRKNSCRIRNELKSRIRISEKNHTGSTMLDEMRCILVVDEI